MKKKLWVIIPILLCIAIGGYFLVTKKNNQEMKRVDIINSNLSNNGSEHTTGYTSEQSSENSTTKETEQQISDSSKEINAQGNEPTLNSYLSIDDIPGNTMGNLANGGVITFDNQWEYFRYYEDNSMYKMSHDGSTIQKISDEGGNWLNIVGDWIYYIKRIDMQPYYDGIFRVKKDGSQKEIVLEGSYRSLIAINNKLYYVNRLDNRKIYRVNLDGTGNELFIDCKSFTLQYENGYLYYNDISDIYRINLSKPETEKVAENVQKFIVYKGAIYYLQNDNRRKLHRKDLDNMSIEVIHEDIQPEFNISNDKIYFMTESPGKIFNMDLNGGNITVLPEGKYKPIRNISAVAGDIVYYWVIFDESEAELDKLARINSDGTINELISDKVKN